MRLEATVTCHVLDPVRLAAGAAARRAWTCASRTGTTRRRTTVCGAEEVHELCRHDKFRFANLLSVWAEVEDGRVVECGHHDGLGPGDGRDHGAGRQDRRHLPRGLAPRCCGRSRSTSTAPCRFVQTVGGRTGVPFPRPVPHPPFVRWQAPLVWTTLALTLRPDGSQRRRARPVRARSRGTGCTTPTGKVVLKSGLADQATVDAPLLRRAHPVARPRPAGAGRRGGVRARAPALARHHARWHEAPRSAGSRRAPCSRSRATSATSSTWSSTASSRSTSTARRSPSSAPARSWGSGRCSRAADVPPRVTALSPLRVAVAALDDIDLGQAPHARRVAPPRGPRGGRR